MLRYTAKNFGRLRDIEITDDNNLSVFVGYNEAGKSYLCDGLRVVLAGQARGCKGTELSQLITHGETGWSLRMAIEGFNASRTSSGGGDSLKSIAAQLRVPVEILPLMFSSEMCGDAGSKSMRAFLDGVAAVAFDPVQHFTADAGIRPCIESAKRAGKSTTKQIIDYCETIRAASKQPPVPVIPSCSSPSDAVILEARQIEEAASADVAALNTELANLTTATRGLAAVATYLQEAAEFNRLSAAASVLDTLPNRRAREALAATRTTAIDGYITLVQNAGYKGGDRMIDELNAIKVRLAVFITEAAIDLAANKAPPSAPVVPMLRKDGEGTFAELTAAMGHAGVTTDIIRDLLTDAAATRTTLQAQLVTASSTFEATVSHREAVSRDRGAWDSYNKAMPEHEQATAKATAEWRRWDIAAKTITEAEAANSAKTGSQFAELVSEFGTSILNGRKLTLDREQGVLLNGASLEVNMSKSERWRVEVCVMAAIARTVNSPLLIIDAADILDDRNKPLFIDWVFNRIVPYFKHTIITSTVRGKIEDEKPFAGIPVTKYLIHNGEVQKLINTTA